MPHRPASAFLPPESAISNLIAKRNTIPRQSKKHCSLALMAFILSPTDAALGQPVLTSPDIPENIKEAINVESGLIEPLRLHYLQTRFR